MTDERLYEREAYVVIKDYGYEGYQMIAVWLDKNQAQRHCDALERADSVGDRFLVYAEPLEPDWTAPGYEARVYGIPTGPLPADSP